MEGIASTSKWDTTCRRYSVANDNKGGVAYIAVAARSASIRLFNRFAALGINDGWACVGHVCV